MDQITAHNLVEVFNLDTKEWKEWSPLKRGRHGTQVIIHKDALYTASGSGNKGGAPELKSIEKFTEQ